MEEQYSPLRTEIKKNGYDYIQIKAVDKIGYIYQQKFEGKHISYEVFAHKINTMFNCVSFPSNESFGLWAWTFKNLDKAEAKLKEMIEKKVIVIDQEETTIEEELTEE